MSWTDFLYYDLRMCLCDWVWSSFSLCVCSRPRLGILTRIHMCVGVYLSYYVPPALHPSPLEVLSKRTRRLSDISDVSIVLECYSWPTGHRELSPLSLLVYGWYSVSTSTGLSLGPIPEDRRKTGSWGGRPTGSLLPEVTGSPWRPWTLRPSLPLHGDISGTILLTVL